VSFIGTGLREIGLKVRRQKTRMALRHEKRLLQKSEIALGPTTLEDFSVLAKLSAAEE
jgi:hypothetical protein